MSSELEARIARLEEENTVLRSCEEELTDFLDNAPVGLHRVGPDGIILWANRAELELLGYARDEYIGRHIRDFHVDQEVITDILSRLLKNERLQHYEARLRCRDGSIRHVVISSNARWQGQTFCHTRCFTRDVTDRKRAEQRLRLQYEAGRLLSVAKSLAETAPALLRTIGEHLQCRAALMWTVEPEGQDRLRCAATWDTTQDNGFAASSQEFSFVPNDGLPGRIWSKRAPDWIAELGKDSNFPRHNLAARYSLRSAFGFPVMLGDSVFGIIECFADDIRLPDADLLQTLGLLGYQIGEFLERVRAQASLAEREHSHRVLTETATDGIITINEDSVIQFVNRSAATLFGYTTEELVGAKLTRLMPERFRQVHDAGMKRYLQTGQRQMSWQAMPMTGLHRDGHDLPLEVSFGEYRQKDKRVLTGIFRDVSERKRLDEKLRQTAKLESLGVLAGGIAHDFNNLLTGILGNLSLAAESTGPDNAIQAQLQNALEATQRAAHLTRQLLAYAGKGRFFVEPINLSLLIREISTMVRSSVPKHVSVRLDLDPTLPPVEADVAQVQQLIMNLVINAAEAVPEQLEGTVLVTTRAQHLNALAIEQALGHNGLKPGHYVVINIQDNGVGMDEATLAKIFDPFFSTKFSGRGLGLAAVLGIVQGHQGGLRVLSSPGQGTTFRVFLPAATEVAAKGETPEPIKTTEAKGGSGTVLVVDDEAIVRKIAAASLERYGYVVITADDGRQGVEQFRLAHKELVAVVLDMTMPIMNGEEALAEMRRIDPSVPVLLSSGYNEAETVRRFSGKGLAGFVQKPYTAAALAERVGAILERSISRARTPQL